MKTLRTPLIILTAALVTLLSFGAVAHAQTVVAAPDGSILDLARPVFDAFSGGHYAYAAALLVILGVALVKRYLGDRYAWLHSDVGGTAMALIVASATAMAAALAAPGAVVTFGLLKTALLVGVGAAGGFAVLKALVIEPILKPLAAKAPAWMQPLFAVLFWVFDKTPAAQAAAETAKAEAAGTAAVAAAPGAGVTAALGQPTDVK